MESVASLTTSSTSASVTRSSASPRLTGMRAGPGCLRALVHHVGCVDHDAPLEQVQRAFAERQVEFLALVRDGMVTGLCSRLRLGILFGTRYGFALYSRAPAHLAQVPHPHVFPISMPVADVLERALSRPGDEFHDDVALVDDNHALIGLIPVDALARLQSRRMAEHVAELQRSREELLAVNDALRQSQGRYAGLFENAAIGVALLDRQGNVHAHNARLAQLLNLEGDQGVVLSLAAGTHEVERPTLLMLLLTLGPSHPVNREFTFNVPARGLRQFRCSFGWIEATRQICACVDDVTEQRLMERQFLRQEKQILLDTLVGGIAHELNNKLTPVQGFSELITYDGDPQVRGYAGMIGKSVAEASHIIRQLLQLSKPTNRAMQIVELRPIVEEALTMLRFQVRETRCQVATTFPAAPAWVEADPAELKQVVINLALNALQAMEGIPAPRMAVRIEEDAGEARIVVVDNGAGISPEHMDRIFDPFFTTKGPEKGSGLGLSVCFGIVRQHGGRIDATSRVGEGAAFTVHLPRHAAPAQVVVPMEAPVRRAPLRPSPELRVLVVEDEPPVRQLIQTVLTTKFGCDVDTVPNGLEAFERLAAHRYALVISDIRMPTMNGTELYLWLREAQPDTARRFVFVTGFPGENHLQRDLADGNIPVLTKPFTIGQLCERCAPFLDAAQPLDRAG